jgi:hypothetical protein
MNNIVATKDGMSVTPMTNIQGLPAMGTKRAIYTGDAAMDSGMAYVIGELEKQDTKIREPLKSITWPRDIVSKTGGGWVEFTSMMNVGFASVGGNANGIIGGQTNAIPTIQADMGKDLFRVFTFAHILRVPFIDQSKLQQIGRSLPELLEKGIQMNYQKSLDQNVYTGYKEMGTEGLVNNSKLVVTAAASTGTASSTMWKDKTPDQILDDINKAITDVWEAAEYDLSGMPNHILIPPQQYALLTSRKVSEAGNVSVLNYLLENNIAKNQGVQIAIEPSRWCIGAGTDGKDRMVVYVNDENMLYFDITVPLARVMTQPSVSDMAYLTAYAGQHGEVKFAYYETARYVDGI